MAFLATKLWANSSYVITIARKRVKIRYRPYYKYEVQTTFAITSMQNDEREKWTSQKNLREGWTIFVYCLRSFRQMLLQ